MRNKIKEKVWVTIVVILLVIMLWYLLDIVGYFTVNGLLKNICLGPLKSIYRLILIVIGARIVLAIVGLTIASLIEHIKSWIRDLFD